MKRWHYMFSGLRISSELCIPEWAVFQKYEAFPLPDVSIRMVKFPLKNEPKTDFSVISKGECRFFFHEAGEYHIRDGQEIIIRALSETKAREIRHFLLGSAWGALSYQRGLLVLHASAVRTDNGVVAFCGPAGSGKSTFTAYLTRNGCPLVSDDLCRFEVNNSLQPVIYPSTPRLKLWRDALSRLEWEPQNLERDHFRLDKFHLPQHGANHSAPLPLAGIHLLDWGDLDMSGLTGLHAVKALVGSATYRCELLEPMGRLASHWEKCTQLARYVSVRRFSRPYGLEKIKEAVQFFMKNL